MYDSCEMYGLLIAATRLAPLGWSLESHVSCGKYRGSSNGSADEI